ncbi:hypothetical protein DY000_02062914 [Brassica cretica]|uniref:Uncharacterized protein n=1 Tax=Brassica cretica TaxID=69181 RepID=A0ABQ7AWF7_BRACR|nr:hypothetical protein DY000_02062914 [Brassica cretica]
MIQCTESNVSDATTEGDNTVDDQQEVSYVNGQGWQYKNYHPNPNVRNNPHLFSYSKADNPVDNAQNSQGQNSGYQKPYQGRTYVLSQAQHNQFQNQKQQTAQPTAPSPATAPQDEIKGLATMMQQLLQGQQIQGKALNQVTTYINSRMNHMFNDLSTKYDNVASHMRQMDVQIAQTAESVKRQQGTLPGKTDKNPRECNAVALRSGRSLPDTIPKKFPAAEKGKQKEGEQPRSEALPLSDEGPEQSVETDLTPVAPPVEPVPPREYTPKMIPSMRSLMKGLISGKVTGDSELLMVSNECTAVSKPKGSPAPIPTSPVEAPACVADHLSFREKLVRRQAEKEQVRAGAELPSSSALAVAPGHGTEGVTPRDTGTLAGSVIPDASALPAGSSTTPILVEDKERAADSMPPPPARKEIVLALRAPSVVPVAQPKGWKRKFTKGGDGESSQQGDSSIASRLRGKFMSLIDGMISECGSETSRLVGELLELQGRWCETEAMLTAVKDSHSVKVSKHEFAIGELERDLGKTASSLLKEKKARKAKSSEVHRLQHQIEGDAGLASRGIREAKDALRSKFQARLAKIFAFLGSLECIRNRDLALATIEGGMAVVQSFQSETPLTLEAEEARLSGCKGDLAVVDGDFDLILADMKFACFLPTCSEGPEGKDPMLGGDAVPGLDEATGEEGA